MSTDINNYVTEPGKFEGQPLWVPKAYDSSLDGCWDEYFDLECSSSKFSLTIVSEEMKNWNLEPDTYAVLIEEDEYGSVYGIELNIYRYHRIIDDLNSAV